MLLTTGEKVHIITRRLFENDLRRHFAGTVEEATDRTVRAQGYVFVFENQKNEFKKRPEKRTRIFSLIDGHLIINVLPADTDVERLEYRRMPPDNRLKLTDGKFTLDINEFGSAR